MSATPAIASLGGYDVLAEIDVGGMGEVLIARKRAVGGFERLVALKTVRGDIAHMETARDMFLDEGRLLARLHHRGIAQVYDFGEDGERLFLAMEYVAGVDFGELKHRAIDPGVACRAMAEAARALQAAHELADVDGTPLGVVHRDVSPGNLMLTYDGSVKVLDFGIALMRGRRAPVTEFGMLKGKPPYMAPEQVRSEAIDPRTDVFSACAVLWEVLTGERLFTGDSIFAIGRAIEEGEVDPPSRHRPEIPPEIDAIVLRGLAKKPEDRYQSAAELAASLEAVASQLGAEALPDYARRELADDRQAHDAYLAKILRDAAEAKPRVGRETHSHTIPAFEVADTAPGDDRPTKQLTPPKLPPTVDEPAPRSRWPLILALVAGLGLLGVAAWQLGVASRTSSSAELADASADASLVADAAIDAQLLPDASRSSIDAAPVPDARTRRARVRDAGARRPRRPDAAPRPPRAVDAAVLEFGFITIPPVEPFVRVVIDGRSIGNSPKFKIKVRAGVRRVTFVNPANDLAIITRSVTVKSNATVIVRAPSQN